MAEVRRLAVLSSPRVAYLTAPEDLAEYLVNASAVERVPLGDDGDVVFGPRSTGIPQMELVGQRLWPTCNRSRSRTRSGSLRHSRPFRPRNLQSGRVGRHPCASSAVDWEE